MSEIKTKLQLQKLVAGYMCLVYYRRRRCVPGPSFASLPKNRNQAWGEGMADALAWMALTPLPVKHLGQLVKAGGIFLAHVGDKEGQGLCVHTVNLAVSRALSNSFTETEVRKLFPKETNDWA